MRHRQEAGLLWTKKCSRKSYWEFSKVPAFRAVMERSESSTPAPTTASPRESVTEGSPTDEGGDSVPMVENGGTNRGKLASLAQGANSWLDKVKASKKGQAIYPRRGG